MMRFTIKFLIVLIFSYLPPASQAVTYYIAPDGDDGNQGDSEASAWRTIDKLNSVGIVNNTTVLFKRGGVFRGSVSYKAFPKNLAVGAYGSGENPILAGSVVITGWKPTTQKALNSKVVYEAEVSSLPLSEGGIQHLFVNGELMTLARYPNVDSPAATNWLKVGASAGKDAFTDPKLVAYKKPNDYWQGATLRIRDYSWTYTILTVTGYTAASGKITAKGLEDQLPEWGYFLDNKLEELDYPGEWYYDANLKKVYFYPKAAGDPNKLLVEGTTYGNFIATRKGVDNVTIEDLTFRHFTGTAVQIGSSDNAVIRNCRFEHNGVGISAWNTTHLLVTGNTLDHQLKAGIGLSAESGYDIKGSLVEKNTLTNNAMYPLYGDRTAAIYQGVGINVAGKGFTVRQNTIENSSHAGIFLQGEGYHVIENNVIRKSLLLLNDGGAVVIQSPGNTIRGNFLLESVGNVDESNGCGSLTTAPCGHHPPYGMGVGAGNNFKDNVIEGNTVANNSDMGIRLNAFIGTIVRNNLLYNNDPNISIEDKKGPSLNNLVEGNIIYAITPNQRGLLLTGKANQAQINNRNYCNPYSEIMAVRDSKPYSLAYWKSAFPEYDKNANNCTFRLDQYQVTAPGPNLIVNSSFDEGVAPWKGVYDLTQTLLDGGSLKLVMSPKDSFSTVSQASLKLVKDQFYRLKFSVVGSDFGNLEVTAKDLVNPDESARVDRTFACDKNRKDYEMVFAFPRTTDNAAIQFLARSYNPADAYWLDNITLEPVSAVLNKATQQSQLFMNTAETVKNIKLRGKYLDLDGNKVTSLTLAPFTSAVLIYQGKVRPKEVPQAASDVEIIDDNFYALDAQGNFEYIDESGQQSVPLEQFKGFGFKLPKGGFSSEISGLLFMTKGDDFFPANTLIVAEKSGKVYWWTPTQLEPSTMDFTPVNAIFSVPTDNGKDSIYYLIGDEIFSSANPQLRLSLQSIGFPTNTPVKSIARDEQNDSYYAVTQSNQIYVYNISTGQWEEQVEDAE